MQIYEYADGAFQDATNLLDRQMMDDKANHHYVRFSDIDGDGDMDVYVTLYHPNEIAFYRNREGRFVYERVLGAAESTRAVAFIHSAGKACADLVTVDRFSIARRYAYR